MKKSVQKIFACLLAALLLASVGMPAFAEGETPVFKAHVVGKTELCDETTPVYVVPGETVLVWFDLQEADDVYIPGWISKTLTENGFELAYDPEFAEENYCAKVTVPSNLAEGAKGLLEINWYLLSEFYSVYKGRWDVAPIYYTHHLTFVVASAAAPAFTDSDTAKETDGKISTLEGITADELLAQAPGGTLLNAEAQAVVGKLSVCSGMVLKLADGRELTVIVKGDNDGDGKVTTNDARNALRAAIGLDHPYDWQIAASLIKSTEKVGTEDARSILRASIGLDKFVLAK
jgi:hypothetical protein